MQDPGSRSTFYLEYALGRQMKNPISLKRGLIHFGIKVDF